MVTPAQLSVLGSMLLDERCVSKVLAETSPSDYMDPDCRMIFQAAQSVYRENLPVDPVTVLDATGRKDKLYDLVQRAMQETPTAANVDVYIPILKDESRLARIQSLGLRLASASTGDDARDVIAQLNDLLTDRQGVEIVDMAAAMTRWYERMKATPEYLTWGLKDLNERLFVERGDFCIIGGFPSAGKTAFALNAAWHMSGKYKVGFFSLETGNDKLTDRTISSVATLDLKRIKNRSLDEEDYAAVAAKSSEITAHRLSFVHASGMTADDILFTAKARQYDVIFIDYLQLIIAGKEENRTQQISAISRALHIGAQKSGITVIALSQLSRQEKNRNGKVRAPRMSDLRESGQLEQDADVIMLLYLDNPDKPDGTRVLAVEKNKESETGMIYLAFDGRHQTFRKLIGSPGTEQPKKKEQKKQDGYQYTFRELTGRDPDMPF